MYICPCCDKEEVESNMSICVSCIQKLSKPLVQKEEKQTQHLSFQEVQRFLDGIKFPPYKARRKGREGYIECIRLPLNPEMDSDYYKEYTEFYVEKTKTTRQYIPNIEDLTAQDWEVFQ